MIAFAQTFEEVASRFDMSLETLDELLRNFRTTIKIKHFAWDEDDENCSLQYPEMLVIDGDQGAVIVKPDFERHSEEELQIQPVFGNYCSVPAFALRKFMVEFRKYGRAMQVYDRAQSL